MIFVTVGGNTPFDRLVDTLDAWAGERGRSDVLAQIGEAESEPRHLRFERFIPADRFRSLMREAEVVIGHAGMGTILNALELRVPLLVMPRRGHLKETRNDHQWVTAEHFAERGVIDVARDEAELRARLDDLSSIRPPADTDPGPGRALSQAIRRWVES